MLFLPCSYCAVPRGFHVNVTLVPAASGLTWHHFKDLASSDCLCLVILLPNSLCSDSIFSLHFDDIFDGGAATAQKKSHLPRDKIDGKYRNRLFAFQRSVESNPFSRVIVVRKEGGGNERELPWGWEREACWEWKKVSYYVIIGIELISKPSATNLL